MDTAGSKHQALVFESPMDLKLKARDFFPRGLSQPSTGFRFSMDALLLAAFARKDPGSRVLDLGTGSGVVGLALALTQPRFFVVGMDKSALMLNHARQNIQTLALESCCALVQADVCYPGGLRPESMDVVVCNPPYRALGTGRVSPSVHKTQARFEDQGGLSDFVRAMAFFLNNGRNGYFIFLAERLAILMTTLAHYALQPKEIIFIHPKAHGPARLVLVRVAKNGGPGLVVQPPLIIHGQGSGSRVLTQQIVDFCPWLACNSGLPRA